MNNFYQIVLNVILSPSVSWIKAKEFGYNWKNLFIFLAFPLIFLSSIAKVTSVPEESIYSIFSQNFLFIHDTITYSLALLLASYMIKLLAPKFSSSNSFNEIYSLFVISYTPFFLSTLIAAIHPSLSIITLVGLVFMVFLFWKGIGIMLETPDNRKTGFGVLCMLILFGAIVITGLFVAVIMVVISGNYDMLNM
ncbi:MAG: hypothetical protein KGZ97_08215 [Bacteroidetes bacterium]|nr:hypothetical protein [Bacteroidota bacterium]